MLEYRRSVEKSGLHMMYSAMGSCRHAGGEVQLGSPCLQWLCDVWRLVPWKGKGSGFRVQGEPQTPDSSSACTAHTQRCTAPGRYKEGQWDGCGGSECTRGRHHRLARLFGQPWLYAKLTSAAEMKRLGGQGPVMGPVSCPGPCDGTAGKLAQLDPRKQPETRHTLHNTHQECRELTARWEAPVPACSVQ